MKVNLFQDFTGRLDVAAALGTADTAMFLYDVEPGESLPYHYEFVPEWLLVVEGAVLVRVPDGEHELERGDIVCFPSGPGGAHQIANRGTETARILLFSEAKVPAVSVYPDSDAVGVWPDDETEFYFKRNDAVSREDALD